MLAPRPRLAMLLGILLVFPVGSTLPSPCVPTWDPLLGAACVDGRGVWAASRDASGAMWFSHGPDPEALFGAPCVENLEGTGIAPEPETGGDGSPSAGPCPPAVPVGCATPDSPHIQVVYLRLATLPSRFADVPPYARAVLERSNGAIDREARTYGYRAQLQVLCDARGAIALSEVVMGAGEAIVPALRAQGYGRDGVKYLVLFDGGLRGQSTSYPDDRLAADNPNAVRPTYAMVSFPTAYDIVLHELTHAMGAVQASAPHTTAWQDHCTDGQDYMCYDDRIYGTNTPDEKPEYVALIAAERARPYDPAACLGREHYDCGGDDYFHPDPPEGSYLAGHWNLASPYNRVLRVLPA